MRVPLNFDHNMPVQLALGLRERGFDVLTAREDGCDQLLDEDLFVRAHELQRVMVTQDTDFLQIASEWLSLGRQFSGLAYCRTTGNSTTGLIADLELIAAIMIRDEALNPIVWIPF